MDKGITLIALVITIIVMLILATVVVNIATDTIDIAELEDIKTEMFSIKAKAKIIEEKYNFKDIESLVGTQLDSDTETEGIQTTYAIPDGLRGMLEQKEEDKYKVAIENLYVWSQDDLNNQGLANITVNDSKFYIVYYNMEQDNTCEVYYSLGYNGVYDLTTLSD